MSLTRFHQAQSSQWSGYATALAEMRRGHKSSHWIWYIFPQIEGLGHSSAAREYALRDLNEACDYLRDPILRARYEEISTAVEEQLVQGVDVGTLMGSSTDVLKLASSLTLFRAAASLLAQTDQTLTPLSKRCDSILQELMQEGFPPCEFTMDRIEHRT
jgi:uncharacterized protein (DUF1810 family)